MEISKIEINKNNDNFNALLFIEDNKNRNIRRNMKFDEINNTFFEDVKYESLEKEYYDLLNEVNLKFKNEIINIYEYISIHSLEEAINHDKTLIEINDGFIFLINEESNFGFSINIVENYTIGEFKILNKPIASLDFYFEIEDTLFKFNCFDFLSKDQIKSFIEIAKKQKELRFKELLKF